MFSSIMLAAGESSRMGSLKALLPWGETSLIEAQIEQIAKSQIGELVVVIGYQYEQLEPKLILMKNRFKHELNIAIMINSDYESGKTSSIRTGMTGISNQSKGVVILGVDQPVRTRSLEQLLSGLEEKAIHIPLFEGKKGHPPMYSRSYYHELGNVSEKNKGLREINHNHPNHIQFIEVHEPQVLLNLNTVEDYIRAKEQGLDSYNPNCIF
jgi:molybdenum cofactor cytidylyltransferase